MPPPIATIFFVSGTPGCVLDASIIRRVSRDRPSRIARKSVPRLTSGVRPINVPRAMASAWGGLVKRRCGRKPTPRLPGGDSLASEIKVS